MKDDIKKQEKARIKNQMSVYKELCDKIRDEKQFKSKEELMKQLESDRLECYKLSNRLNYTK